VSGNEYRALVTYRNQVLDPVFGPHFIPYCAAHCSYRRLPDLLYQQKSFEKPLSQTNIRERVNHRLVEPPEAAPGTNSFSQQLVQDLLRRRFLINRSRRSPKDGSSNWASGALAQILGLGFASTKRSVNDIISLANTSWATPPFLNFPAGLLVNRSLKKDWQRWIEREAAMDRYCSLWVSYSYAP
jgi:hypothetical protein